MGKIIKIELSESVLIKLNHDSKKGRVIAIV